MLWRLVSFSLAVLNLPFRVLLPLLIILALTVLHLVVLALVLPTCGWLPWARKWWMLECRELLFSVLSQHRVLYRS